MFEQIDSYAIVKTLHILSGAILFGTGLGTAFFMFRSRYAPGPAARYEFARTTVLADCLFTAPAVVLQPLTGMVLVGLAGHDPFEYWLAASYLLYIVAGLCWLPVVWIQIALKKMLLRAVETGTDLPDRYYRLARTWFWLGWPAFLALVAVFFLMVAKPVW